MDKPLWDLKRLDSGDRSLLKRSIGRSLGEDLRAAEAFYRALGHVPKSKDQEEQLFFCLCMECLWKTEDNPRVLPFEEMLRRLYYDENSTDSMKRRIISALDIPWSNDGFLQGKMAGFVKKMRNTDGSLMPDFFALAEDLMRWNNSEHSVQRRWIQVVCRTRQNEEENKEREEE